MNRNDLIIIVACLMIVCSIIIGGWAYYVSHLESCTSNPLRYAAEKLEKDYGYEFFGSGLFIRRNSPTIYFNAHNVTMVKQSIQLDKDLFDMEYRLQKYIDNLTKEHNQ